MCVKKTTRTESNQGGNIGPRSLGFFLSKFEHCFPWPKKAKILAKPHDQYAPWTQEGTMFGKCQGSCASNLCSQVVRSPRRRRPSGSRRSGHGRCLSLGVPRPRRRRGCGSSSPPRRGFGCPRMKGSPRAPRSSASRPSQRRRRPRGWGPSW